MATRMSERIALTGLVLLGLASLATGRYVAEAIEARALASAENAVQSLETPDLVVRADGLNLELSGRVATAAERDEAVAAIRNVLGSGRLIDNLIIIEPLVDLRPAVLRIQKDAQTITLTGEAPNAEARDLLALRVARARAGYALSNLMKAQDRRAASDWLTAAEAAIDAIVALEVGTARVERGVVAIEGAAPSARRKTDVLAGLREALRGGFTLEASISSPPPLFSPYVFSARKDGRGLLVEACAAPTAASQALILNALGERRARGADAERCPVANGAPNRAWPEAVGRAIASLDLVSEGEARILDDQAEIVGFAKTAPDVARARAAAGAGWPEGYAVAVDIRRAPDIASPFEMTIVKRPGDARLAGHTPSLGRAQVWAERLDATNELTLARGAPEGWTEAIDALVEAMAELKIGVAEIRNYGVRVAAPGDASARAQLRGRLQARLPRQFAVEVVEAKAPRASIPSDVIAAATSASASAEAADAAAKNRYVFVARKAAETDASVAGVARDEASREAIATYARAKLGGEALKVEIEISAEAPPVGWQRAIFASLDALAHLESGEAVTEPGAFYLRGQASRAVDARRAVIAAKRKTPDEFTHFSWITVREDATALARREAAKQPLTPTVCVALANEIAKDAETLFEPGQASLAAASAPLLEDLALTLQRCADAKIEIGGHTDSQGSPDANLALSEQRARAVRWAMVGLGVDNARLTSVGYGAENPIADNETEEGRAANRRIEFKLAD